MSQPTIIQTITGPDGFATCYVSFKDVVALDGALTGVPEVTTESSLVAITDKAITFAGTINGVSYSAGDVLTFKVTAAQDSGGVAWIDIEYETPARKETIRVGVKLAKWTV